MDTTSCSSSSFITDKIWFCNTEHSIKITLNITEIKALAQIIYGNSLLNSHMGLLLALLVLNRHMGLLLALLVLNSHMGLLLALLAILGRRPLYLLILYSVGRTPWTGDRPVARPLPTHKTTQNKHTRTCVTLVGFELETPSV
jgi:hypothetical protein